LCSPVHSQNIFGQHLTGLSHTLFHESQIVRSVVQYCPSMPVTFIIGNSVTLFLVGVILSKLALLYCVVSEILFVACRVCWMSGRTEGGTGPDCIRKTMAYLVLQVPHMRHSSAWRIHGEVSVLLAAWYLISLQALSE